MLDWVQTIEQVYWLMSSEDMEQREQTSYRLLGWVVQLLINEACKLWLES